MAFKFIILCTTLAAVSAGVIETGWQQPQWNPHTAAVYHQPAVIKQVQSAIIKKVVEAEAPANYEFNYEVHDTHTGDIKRQHEKAENGHISGQYSLVDPDGFRRVVSYTADDHHGFQADVKREPVDHKIIAPAHGWQAKPAHGWQAPTVTKVIQPAHGWQSAPSHGWQAPTVTKVIQPAHGWQSAPSHGWQAPTVTKVVQPATITKVVQPVQSHEWQAPTVVKVQAPSHGWQSNPWA